MGVSNQHGGACLKFTKLLVRTSLLKHEENFISNVSELINGDEISERVETFFKMVAVKGGRGVDLLHESHSSQTAATTTTTQLAICLLV